MISSFYNKFNKRLGLGSSNYLKRVNSSHGISYDGMTSPKAVNIYQFIPTVNIIGTHRTCIIHVDV